MAPPISFTTPPAFLDEYARPDGLEKRVLTARPSAMRELLAALEANKRASRRERADARRRLDLACAGVRALAVPIARRIVAVRATEAGIGCSHALRGLAVEDCVSDAMAALLDEQRVSRYLQARVAGDSVEDSACRLVSFLRAELWTASRRALAHHRREWAADLTGELSPDLGAQLARQLVGHSPPDPLTILLLAEAHREHQKRLHRAAIKEFERRNRLAHFVAAITPPTAVGRARTVDSMRDAWVRFVLFEQSLCTITSTSPYWIGRPKNSVSVAVRRFTGLLRRALHNRPSAESGPALDQELHELLRARAG